MTGLLSNEQIKRLCDALADGSGGELTLGDAHALVVWAEEHMAAAALAMGAIQGRYLVRRGEDGDFEWFERERSPAA